MCIRDSANSIIIRDAQNLGLAQLYQIRGRVGRGYKQGYCHLLIPKKPLEKSAFRRLRSLEKNTALGSGYNISMEDLEIRGAGSIFGRKQSGHITTVGFQMYCDLLSIEIQKTKSGSGAVQKAPQVTTSFQPDISSDYIENMSLRIDYYYRVGSATSFEQLNKIEKELVDVFGPIPDKTEKLLLVASSRSVGKSVSFKGEQIEVIGLETALADKPDLALFSAGGATSLEWAPKFAAQGVKVIDNSSAWRMDPTIKLVVPEINASVITSEDMIIANPNCSTIQMVMALAPLHEKYGLLRLVISTYQSITGTGVKACLLYTSDAADE